MSIYKLSFKNFKKRKLRSALTMLGIVIGVTTLILLLGFSTGAKTYMEDQTANMAGDIVIANSSAVAVMGSVQGDAYLNKNTISKIKNMSQLYNFREQAIYTGILNKLPIMIIGTNDWNQIKINGTPSVVIDRYLADSGYKIGSKIKIKDQEFTVTGITDSSSVSSSTGQMGLIYTDTDKVLTLNGSKVSQLSASVKGDPETVKKEVEDNINGTSAYTQSDFTKQIDDMMNGEMIFMGAIASIALIVGIISIINIMLVNVTERTREIGVLKAIGFKNREILGSILAESGLLGFIGALAGVIIAALLMEIGIIYLFQQHGMEGFSLANMLPLWLVAGVIGGATILSILAGLYPAWRASRLNVVEALRYE